MGFDTTLFKLINSTATVVPALDGVMRLLVNDYFVPAALCLLAAALWFSGANKDERKANQRAVLLMIVAVLLGNVLVKANNLVYFRPRPFSVQEVNLLFYRPSDSSLPSNAAAVGFAFAGVGWLRYRRLGLIMGVLASLFAVARVYCGVHYPLDVVAGGFIGVFSAWVVGRGQRLMQPLLDALIAVGRRLYLA